jgi:drug/metabolite transporter (DMT)-like permease
MFSSWIFYVVIFVIAQIVFLQTFKYVAKDSKSIGALTVLVQVISAVTSAVMILVLLPLSGSVPAFGWQWPGGDWVPWVLLAISFVLFAVNDRLDATTRKNMDITVDTMLHQVYRLLFFPMLIIILSVPFRWPALVGGIIIVLANMWLAFDKSKFKFNKYVWLKLLSVVFFAAALTTQLESLNSGDFNIPFFAVLSFGVPALMLAGVRQATPFSVVKEMRRKEWWIILICGVAQALFCICLYVFLTLDRAESINANAISAVYVLLNVVFAYIFLKERNNLLKKIIAAIIIVAAVVMIVTAPLYA